MLYVLVLTLIVLVLTHIVMVSTLVVLVPGSLSLSRSSLSLSDAHYPCSDAHCPCPKTHCPVSLDPPQILSVVPRDRAELRVNNRTVLTCKADSNPEPRYQARGISNNLGLIC